MTILAYLDQFAVSTGTAGTTQARTGYGFPPKAVIVWGFGRTEAFSTSAAASVDGSVGFASGPSSRMCHYLSVLNADATPDALSTINTSSIYSAGFGAGTDKLDIQSFDPDGVTFVVDNQFSVAKQVFVLAIGGDSITNASILTMTSSGVGTQAYTGAGFQPTSGIFIMPLNSSTNASFSLGASTGPNGSITSRCVRVASDTADPSQNRSALQSASAYFQNASGAAAIGTVATWDSDGASIAWSSSGGGNPSGFTAYGLLLRTNPSNALTIGNFTTRTDTTTDIPVSGLPTAPAFGLVVAPSSTSSYGRISVGAFAGAGNLAQNYAAQDAVGTSSVTTGINFTNCYGQVGGGAAGRMKALTFTATGVNFRMSFAENSGETTTGFALIGGAPTSVRGAPIFF